MHERQVRHVVRLLQVEEVAPHLLGRELPLVHDCARVQGAHVKVLHRRVGTHFGGGEDAQPPELAVQLAAGHGARPARHDQLLDGGLALQASRPKRRVIHWERAPRHQLQAELVDVLLEDGLALSDRIGIVGEEEVAHAVLARGRQAGLDAPKEGVWHSRQDAGTVTGIGLAAAATAVGHAHEHRVGVRNDLVARLSLEAGDHADATAILFECGIIEALLGWEAFQAWGGGGYSPQRAPRQRAGRAAAKRPHQATQHREKLAASLAGRLMRDRLSARRTRRAVCGKPSKPPDIKITDYLETSRSSPFADEAPSWRNAPPASHRPPSVPMHLLLKK